MHQHSGDHRNQNECDPGGVDGRMAVARDLVDWHVVQGPIWRPLARLADLVVHRWFPSRERFFSKLSTESNPNVNLFLIVGSIVDSKASYLKIVQKRLKFMDLKIHVYMHL